MITKPVAKWRGKNQFSCHLRPSNTSKLVKTDLSSFTSNTTQGVVGKRTRLTTFTLAPLSTHSNELLKKQVLKLSSFRYRKANSIKHIYIYIYILSNRNDFTKLFSFDLYYVVNHALTTLFNRSVLQFLFAIVKLAKVLILNKLGNIVNINLYVAYLYDICTCLKLREK